MDDDNFDKWELGIFEEKFLHRIYYPWWVVNGKYSSQWNDELFEIYRHINIVQRIKKQRLCRISHVVRLDENTPLDAVLPVEAEEELEKHFEKRKTWLSLVFPIGAKPRREGMNDLCLRQSKEREKVVFECKSKMDISKGKIRYFRQIFFDKCENAIPLASSLVPIILV